MDVYGVPRNDESRTRVGLKERDPVGDGFHSELLKPWPCLMGKPSISMGYSWDISSGYVKIAIEAMAQSK